MAAAAAEGWPGRSVGSPPGGAVDSRGRLDPLSETAVAWTCTTAAATASGAALLLAAVSETTTAAATAQSVVAAVTKSASMVAPQVPGVRVAGMLVLLRRGWVGFDA